LKVHAGFTMVPWSADRGAAAVGDKVISVMVNPQPIGAIVRSPQAPQELAVPEPDATIAGSVPSAKLTFPENGAA
jgi:hypothetical protein